MTLAHQIPEDVYFIIRDFALEPHPTALLIRDLRLWNAHERFLDEMEDEYESDYTDSDSDDSIREEKMLMFDDKNFWERQYSEEFHIDEWKMTMAENAHNSRSYDNPNTYYGSDEIYYQGCSGFLSQKNWCCDGDSKRNIKNNYRKDWNKRQRRRGK